MARQGSMQIGVNLGFMRDDLPSIPRIVELLSDLHAGPVRLYDANPELLNALSNRPHEVIVSVRNDQLPAIATSPNAAHTWVETSVVPFYPATKITFIAVGNEVFRKGNIRTCGPYLFGALKNIYRELVARNLDDDIKVISPLSGDILGSFWPPSSGSFRTSMPYVRCLLQFLQDTGSTFVINLYPYYAYIAQNMTVSLEFATFQSRAPPFIDHSSSHKYSNLFDAMLDAAYHAIEELGFPDLPLAVGETGWPTDGGNAASIQNAELFNSNLVRHLYRNGTPGRPQKRTPVFIFALFNENQKPGLAYERSWGLLNADGTRVYPIDLADPNMEREAPTMPLPRVAGKLAPAYHTTQDNPKELADPNIVPVNAPAAIPIPGANGDRANPVDLVESEQSDDSPTVFSVFLGADADLLLIRSNDLSEVETILEDLLLAARSARNLDTEMDDHVVPDINGTTATRNYSIAVARYTGSSSPSSTSSTSSTEDATVTTISDHSGDDTTESGSGYNSSDRN